MSRSATTRRSTGNRAVAIAAAVGAMVGALWLTPAAAQDANQIRALAEQLQQLRAEFNELQRYAYGGEAPPAAGAAEARAEQAAEAAGVAGRVQAEQAALFEIRLGALEEEIRTLTGTLERIGFGVTQNTQRIERLAADLEFRLQALEQAAAPADADAMAAAPGAAPAPAAAGAPVAAPPGGAAGAQVLGVLPAPRPDDGVARAAPEIPAEPEPTAEERYELAYGLLQQFRTEEAEFAFNEFLEIHPDHELATNAHYWLGETYYSRQMFGDAARTFFAAYNAAPTGPKAADNFLKLGMSLARMEQATEACAVLGEMPQRFPDAAEAVRSQATAERARLDCP